MDVWRCIAERSITNLRELRRSIRTAMKMDLNAASLRYVTAGATYGLNNHQFSPLIKKAFNHRCNHFSFFRRLRLILRHAQAIVRIYPYVIIIIENFYKSYRPHASRTLACVIMYST